MKSLTSFKSAAEIEQLILQTTPHCALILFDLDGTLFNHDLFVYDRIVYALETSQLVESESEIQVEIYNRILHYGTHAILDYVCENLVHNADKRDLLNALRNYEPLIPQLYFRENTKDVLSQLRHNYSLAICTNGNKQQQVGKTQSLVSTLGFEIPVHFCIESESKPSPVCLNIAKSGFAKSEVVFIGDTQTDLEASQRAEIGFIDIQKLVIK